MKFKRIIIEDEHNKLIEDFGNCCADISYSSNHEQDLLIMDSDGEENLAQYFDVHFREMHKDLMIFTSLDENNKRVFIRFRQ